MYVGGRRLSDGFWGGGADLATTVFSNGFSRDYMGFLGTLQVRTTWIWEWVGLCGDHSVLLG